MDIRVITSSTEMSEVQINKKIKGASTNHSIYHLSFSENRIQDSKQHIKFEFQDYSSNSNYRPDIIDCRSRFENTQTIISTSRKSLKC